MSLTLGEAAERARAARLTKEVERLTRERDDARRRYCCRLADDRRAKHVREGNGDSRESVASNLGWGYLYTEEPKP